MSDDSAFAPTLDDEGDDEWRESSEPDLADVCVHGVPFDEGCEDCEEGDDDEK